MKKILFLLFLISFGLYSQNSHVRWTNEVKKLNDCEYEIIFRASIDKHWHIYSVHQKANDGPNATSFSFTPNPDYKLIGGIFESPAIKEFDKVFDMNVAYHERKAFFSQKIKLLSPKKITIKGKYEAQCCDSAECSFPPADAFSFEFQGTKSCIPKDESFGMKLSQNVCICDTQAILKGIRSKGIKDAFGLHVSANACECDTAAILAQFKNKAPEAAKISKPEPNQNRVLKT